MVATTRMKQLVSSGVRGVETGYGPIWDGVDVDVVLADGDK